MSRCVSFASGKLAGVDLTTERLLESGAAMMGGQKSLTFSSVNALLHEMSHVCSTMDFRVRLVIGAARSENCLIKSQEN